VNCRLTLSSSSVRTDTSTDGGYARVADGDDSRFKDEIGLTQSIVTSSGQNDSGLFELNFNDPRYLPFERRGAISNWLLELSGSTDFPQFDPQSISDVIIHVKYTARDGGAGLKTAAGDSITDAINAIATGSKETALMQGFSVRHEFSDAWYRFLHVSEADGSQSLVLEITRDYFPYLFHSKTIKISKVSVLLVLVDASDYDNSKPLTLSVNVGGADAGSLAPEASSADTEPPWGGQPFNYIAASVDDLFGDNESVKLTLTADPTTISDLPDAYKDSSSGTARLNADAFEN
jgi:hypothetical protein